MLYNGDVDLVCNFLSDEWFGHVVAEAAMLNVRFVHALVNAADQ